MPATEVRAFRDENGNIPIRQWLDDLEQSEPRAYSKCLASLLTLEEKGSELRRPLSDSLRDGVREVRMRVGTVHYRILFFFCGKNIVCLSHGITKEGEVPSREIELAIKRKKLVASDAGKYTADFEI